MTRAELADAPGAGIYPKPLRRYDHDLGRVVTELEDGQDLCQTCWRAFDECDLFHAGPLGDGEATCAVCVRNGDREYQQMRLLLVQAAAVLGTPDKSAGARSLSARIQNLLDRE